VSRRLLLFRHGKAESPVGIADKDRPLANKGRGQSLRAGVALRERGITPDHAVVSPSQRTRETWEAFLLGLELSENTTLEPEQDQRVYDNTVDDLLDAIHETPTDRDVLVVVGHNPSIAGLAGLLDEDGYGPDHKALAEGFPTGSLAVFETDEPWYLVRAGTARLVEFIRPNR
jgi:phosphohistidine phosphatase